MHSCEGTGKNIEQAIQNALFELKASREDVDIKILNEGGFLKKAKVLVSIAEDSLYKYEKRAKLKEEEKEEEKKELKPDKEIADDDFAEVFVKQKITMVESVPEKKENKIRIVTDEEYVATTSVPEEAEQRHERKISGEDFLKGLLECLQLEGTIEVTEDERFEKYNLKGENLNDLIGHHGECMLSLSYLMSLICKSENRKRIVLDVENYREKREESLTSLAKRIASKVAKTGRYYKLEPMDASERKVIHTALQEDDRVTTLSKGEEPHRYLIVFPREYSTKD